MRNGRKSFPAKVSGPPSSSAETIVLPRAIYSLAWAETLHVQRRQHRGDVDEPKTESSRRVRQIGALAGEIDRHAAGRGPKDFIFTRRDGGLLDDLQQHVFLPAAEAIGIYFEGFGMHTFRRLNISWRQEAGATPFEAMKAAGHGKPDTTCLYTITDEERERQHVNVDGIAAGGVN